MPAAGFASLSFADLVLTERRTNPSVFTSGALDGLTHPCSSHVTQAPPIRMFLSLITVSGLSWACDTFRTNRMKCDVCWDY